MAKRNAFDTVYYWTGGTEFGAWHETLHSASDDLDDVVLALRRQGYIAVKGKRSIGAPEGPPDDGAHSHRCPGCGCTVTDTCDAPMEPEGECDACQHARANGRPQTAAYRKARRENEVA